MPSIRTNGPANGSLQNHCQGVMTYKILHDLYPENLSHKFTERSMISEYSTRNREDLQIAKVRLEYAKPSFYFLSSFSELLDANKFASMFSAIKFAWFSDIRMQCLCVILWLLLVICLWHHGRRRKKQLIIFPRWILSTWHDFAPV